MNNRRERNTIRLTLFGTLHIHQENQTVAIASKPISALLGYLALNAAGGRAVARAAIASKLWPDLPESRARQALNDTLYRLRQILGGVRPWLDIDTATIRLGEISTDVAAFKMLASRAELAEWQAAVELYTGELLEHLDVDWLLGPRIALHDVYLQLLARICAALTESGHIGKALEYARRWAVADPFNEDAHCSIIRLYARLGRHATALQHYDHLVQLLEEELQTAPLPDTRALANAIRAEYHAIPEYRPPPRPFIGRRDELARLLAQVEQVQQGHSMMVLLEGETGIGKTRLLQALAEGAIWRGVRVVQATVQQFAPQSPYAPLAEALRAALAGPVADQLRPHVSATAAHLLTQLMTHLTIEHHEHAVGRQSHAAIPRDHTVASAGAIIQPHMPAAFADTLIALSTIAPHLIIFDDVQWAEERFWTALQVYARQAYHQRLLVVLSYRSDTIRANPTVWRVLRDLDRSVAPERVVLHGLMPGDCAELAHFFGISLDQDTTQMLHCRTGGNPLFLLELFAAGVGDQVPETLGALLDSRLAQLVPAAQAALEAAAVIGHEFSYAPWQSLAGVDLLPIAPALVSQQFLDEVMGGYRFRHGIMHEHVYAALPPARRRELHQRAAEVLQHDAEVAAWHYAQAHVWGKAMQMYQAAGDRAAHAGDYTTAREHYERALALSAQALDIQEERHMLHVSWEQAVRLEARWRALHPTPPPITVQLARADAPLGRPLARDESVTIKWTVDAGELDAAILRRARKGALRRHRIVRLIAEAYAQGAAPTDQDLAQALGVTERTIAADMRALRATGHQLSTRGRKSTKR